MFSRTFHTCSPKFSQRCHICGQLLSIPYFCSSCGMDISDPHDCVGEENLMKSTPLFRNSHTCRRYVYSLNCSSCGLPLPSPSFCSSCGMDISDPHDCPPKPSKHICRPVFLQQKCRICGMFLPSPYYCSSCGMDISEPHLCQKGF